MAVRSKVLVLFATSAVALAAAPGASAQVPATLTGETLVNRPGTNTRFQITCNPEGQNSTGSFTSAGIATGPYPGTYTESGTFTVETRPRSEPLGPHISAFDASFTITSPDATVTGTKHLRIEPFSIGDCDPAFDPGPEDDGAEIAIRADYEARIQTALGTFVDRGVSEVFTQDVQTTTDLPGRTQEFLETFQSSLLAPEPAPPDQPLRPGKGCGDKNHAHAREGDCKKPPR